MTCANIRPLLMDYVLRRLSAAETTAVASHLESCAECCAVLHEEQAIGRTLAAVPAAAPRRDLWSVVEAHREKAMAPRPSLLQRLRPFFAVRPVSRFAMAPALAAAVAAVLLVSPTRTPQTTATAEAVIAISQVREASMQSDDPMGDFSDRTWDALAAQGRS